MKGSFIVQRLLGLTVAGFAATSAMGYISTDSFETYDLGLFEEQDPSGWTVNSNDLSEIVGSNVTFSACALPLTGTYDSEGAPLTTVDATHTQVLQLNTEGETIVRAVSDTDTTDVMTYVDTMVYLVPSDDTPEIDDTSVQAAVYLNAESNIVVFCGSEAVLGVDATNRFVATDQQILPETWYRLTITMDYATDGDAVDQAFFKVEIDGDALTSDLGYLTVPTTGLPAQAAGGMWFRAANVTSADNNLMNSVSLKGTGMIDDFVVTTQTPDFIGGEEEQFASDGVTPIGWVNDGSYTDAANQDGDAYSLYEEYLMGSNPDVSNSWTIDTIAIDGLGILTLTWAGVATDADAVTVQGADAVDGSYSEIAGTITFDTDTYTFVSDATVAGLTAFKLEASDE